jgi:uncharacterized protein (DUF433 family)
MTLRIEQTTQRRLAERARSERLPQGALVQRYVEEGLRRDRYPRLTFVPKTSGRLPALASRPRLLVANIVEAWRAGKRDLDRTARYFEVPIEDVRAAIAYYAEFADEVDDWIAWNGDEAERLEQEWRREQKLQA